MVFAWLGEILLQFNENPSFPGNPHCSYLDFVSIRLSNISSFSELDIISKKFYPRSWNWQDYVFFNISIFVFHKILSELMKFHKMKVFYKTHDFMQFYQLTRRYLCDSIVRVFTFYIHIGSRDTNQISTNKSSIRIWIDYVKFYHVS